MKIFLVGGFGFIGKRFLRKFSANYEIVVYATKKDILDAKNYMDLSKVIVEEGSIENDQFSSLIKSHNPDVIIHLAALTGIDKCRDNSLEAFKTNVFGTFNVVNSCLDFSPKFIFISSREVYGETLTELSMEDDPLLPNNTYGVTKLLGERIVKLAGDKNSLDYRILRLTNVYGPEGDQYGPQKMIINALRENKINIFGGSQKMNFIYVDDVVDIIDFFIKDKNSSKQIFNVGSEETISIEELAKKISQLLGGNISFEQMGMRKTETSKFLPDINKLKKIFNKSPTPIEVGLNKTIEWYRNKYN